ncbi:hypothetical protein AAFF_G00341830 [Aldrovandia affinis]|uniref:Uncharacterized protein n=1 Tax=Aldrovandia affinis TaxID=143900 RepID=A0AAD7SL38_9TELE|nr:hypothetical protein AAFF_G00341830 [Aldrovandia affinis]
MRASHRLAEGRRGSSLGPRPDERVSALTAVLESPSALSLPFQTGLKNIIICGFFCVLVLCTAGSRAVVQRQLKTVWRWGPAACVRGAPRAGPDPKTSSYWASRDLPPP